MTRTCDNNLDAFALLDALPVGVVVHGSDSRILYANSKALAVLKMSAQQALDKSSAYFQGRIIDTYRKPLPLEAFPVNRVLATGKPVQGQLLGVINGDGKTSWLTVNAVSQTNAQGHIERVMVTFTENPYVHADIPFKEIVDSAQDIIMVTEAYPLAPPGPRIIYVNQAFTRLTGFRAEEVIGQNPRILQGKDADPEVLARIRDGLVAGQPIREIIYNYSKQGVGYWLDMHIVPLKNAQGEVAYFGAIERDVTAQKDLEDELRHFAFHDSLTRLPNRRQLFDRLRQSQVLARENGSLIAVLFIDLNKFKQLNDAMGHGIGDLFLIEVARRLSEQIRATDLVARFGGDEFVVLLDGLCSDPDQARTHVKQVVNKIQAALQQPFILGELVHHGSASIGIKLVENIDELDVDQILRDADAAMYAMKKDCQ